MEDKRPRRNKVQEAFSERYMGKEVKLVWRDVLTCIEKSRLGEFPILDPEHVAVGTVTSVPKSRKVLCFSVLLSTGKTLVKVPMEIIDRALGNLHSLPPLAPEREPTEEEVPSFSQEVANMDLSVLSRCLCCISCATVLQTAQKL